LRSQLEIQETTFKTIGSELHDNIGQLLSVVKLSLSGLPIKPDEKAYEPLQNIREVVNEVAASISDLTKTLHTDRITNVGLVESIRLELNMFRKNGLIEAKMKVTGKEQILDKQSSVFLFRIFQEVTNNALKHSGASKLTISVSYNFEHFLMEISDNGKGFNLDEKLSKGNSVAGVGLNSMYNRAALIGAKFAIKSSVGEGTTVTIELPLMESIGTN
jgi:signal transduction histidine kinase